MVDERAMAAGIAGYYESRCALQIAALRARELGILLHAVASYVEPSPLRIALAEWIADAALLERRITNGSKWTRDDAR